MQHPTSSSSSSLCTDVARSMSVPTRHPFPKKKVQKKKRKRHSITYLYSLRVQKYNQKKIITLLKINKKVTKKNKQTKKCKKKGKKKKETRLSQWGARCFKPRIASSVLLSLRQANTMSRNRFDCTSPSTVAFPIPVNLETNARISTAKSLEEITTEHKQY